MNNKQSNIVLNLHGMAVWSHNQTNCYLCMWRILQYWSFMMFQRKINSIINKKLLIRENRRTQWRKKYYVLKVGKFKFNERPLQQFCKNIFAFCIFWYFMLLRQRKEYWLSFSEGDNIQYIHLGRNMNFSWDRGFYKVGSKLQNRAFQDPPSQNPSCPKNL